MPTHWQHCRSLVVRVRPEPTRIWQSARKSQACDTTSIFDVVSSLDHAYAITDSGAAHAMWRPGIERQTPRCLFLSSNGVVDVVSGDPTRRAQKVIS
jgi:hypothetical protein